MGNLFEAHQQDSRDKNSQGENAAPVICHIECIGGGIGCEECVAGKQQDQQKQVS